MIGQLILLVKPRISQIQLIANSFKHSHKFSNYCRYKSNRFNNIATFTPVRWYSIINFLESFYILQDRINEFLILQKKALIPEHLFNFAKKDA